MKSLPLPFNSELIISYLKSNMSQSLQDQHAHSTLLKQQGRKNFPSSNVIEFEMTAPGIQKQFLRRMFCRKRLWSETRVTYEEHSLSVATVCLLPYLLTLLRVAPSHLQGELRVFTR